MLQSTIVSKIYKDLLLFGHLSLAKSSYSWYSSFIKNFQNFSKYIFSKNSSFIANLNFTNSSFEK